MTAPRSDAIFQVGDLLNNTFRIEASLGRGGTSEVFRARNEISGRPVALKVLKAEFAGNEDFLVLMKREEEMRDIRHDAVVRYSENHRTNDGHIYLVMDYVDGPSLDVKMRQGGMSADDLMIVGRRVAEGLQAAHERRIVHRDLSPDNIILRNGDPSDPVIIDFGIAKDANPGAATIVGNEFAGKFAYAAPEQLAGNTDARSDIYSLGATLLATFRGERPDIGSNLMDVIRIKNAPLDLSDVPAPLSVIIDRMTRPEADERFQTCQQILDAIAPEAGAPREDTAINADQTVIMPKAHVPETDPTPPSKPPVAAKKAAAKPPKPSKAAKEPKPPRSRTPMLAALAVLVLGGGAAGAWFGGLFGASYPKADPYILVAERSLDGIAMIGGNVPSPDTLASLADFAESEGAEYNLALASGDISNGWGEALLTVLEATAALDAFNLEAEGNRFMLTGDAPDDAVRTQIAALTSGGRLPDDIVLEVAIGLGPAVLTADMLSPILEEQADCGPLALKDFPAAGLARDGGLVITGQLSDASARIGLFDAISTLAGDREVTIDTETLNPALCAVEGHLPNVPAGGIGIAYSFGDTGQANNSGRFFVGENPVIDVLLPADVETGFLYVSIIDVTGSVFHLLPNANRPDNAIAVLRDGQTGDVPVRVAYSISERSGSDKLAFEVQDTELGSSKVLVLRTDAPLFHDLRPISESVEGYAQALEEERANAEADIRSLDSRVLITARP